MYPSAALCRAQEAFQRDRAISTLLPNVRTVAERAAAAWGIEARSAEKRERRLENVRLIAAGRGDEAHPADGGAERSFSENPDRGCASAASRPPASH